MVFALPVALPVVPPVSMDVAADVSALTAPGDAVGGVDWALVGSVATAVSPNVAAVPTPGAAVSAVMAAFDDLRLWLLMQLRLSVLQLVVLVLLWCESFD